MTKRKKNKMKANLQEPNEGVAALIQFLSLQFSRRKNT
jgi:hypothetical protein